MSRSRSGRRAKISVDNSPTEFPETSLSIYDSGSSVAAPETSFPTIEQPDQKQGRIEGGYTFGRTWPDLIFDLKEDNRVALIFFVSIFALAHYLLKSSWLISFIFFLSFLIIWFFDRIFEKFDWKLTIPYRKNSED